MRATIFYYSFAHSFFAKVKILLLIVHNLVVRKLFDSNIFFTKSRLNGNDNQYNKISEESDTAEDHVNSDDTTNKFAPLNLESTHKWYVTNPISFI
jgi:hypothetical protein